jgi:uncharacterized protein YkwD
MKLKGRRQLGAGTHGRPRWRDHRWAKTALMIAVALLITSGDCDGTGSLPAQDLLDQINQKRAEGGCPAVAGNDQLRVAAEREAVDMRDNSAHLQPGTDGHTGSDGSRPEQRIAAAGFAPASRTGEIIYSATGPPGNTVAATIDAWMRSDLHRGIILTCGFTHAGVGLLYPGGVSWFAVVDFAAH